MQVVRARHFPHTKWANCRDRERHLRDLVNIRPISRDPPPNPSNTPWSGPCVRPQGAPGDGLAWGIDRPARSWLTWRHLGMSKDLGGSNPRSTANWPDELDVSTKRALAPSMPAGRMPPEAPADTRPGRHPASCQLVNLGMSKTGPRAPARRRRPFKPTGGAPLPSHM